MKMARAIFRQIEIAFGRGLPSEASASVWTRSLRSRTLPPLTPISSLVIDEVVLRVGET